METKDNYPPGWSERQWNLVTFEASLYENIRGAINKTLNEFSDQINIDMNEKEFQHRLWYTLECVYDYFTRRR